MNRSSSIETLEKIVKNYQRNEQRLHDLQQYVRHERKKAERLLNEATQRPKQPVEYFLSFDNDQPKKSTHHRVRFTLPNDESKRKNYDDELAELSQRCENLLSTLHFYRPRSALFSPLSNNDSSLTLQEALHVSRPDFISHSQQRSEHIQHLREDRQYHRTRTPSPVHYIEMKRTTKEKYDQLPEVNERLQKDLSDENKRRNYLRAKLFQHRLQQHVLLQGRTNINESLTMLNS